MLSMISALSYNNVIGKDGKLPWNLPGDLVRFRDLTIGKTVLVGPNTLRSITSYLRDKNSEPLKGRRKIVLTHQTEPIPYCEIVNDWESIIDRSSSGEDFFVIGGASLYKIFLPHTKMLYLTRVKTVIENGDAFFPNLDLSEWGPMYDPINMIAEMDPRDEYPWTIEDLERK